MSPHKLIRSNWNELVPFAVYKTRDFRYDRVVVYEYCRKILSKRLKIAQSFGTPL